MKTSFKNCPRCHNPWKEVPVNYFAGHISSFEFQTMRCSVCDLHSNQFSNNIENYTFSFGPQTYIIHWNMETLTCLVFKGGSLKEIVDAKADEKIVILPLLPFDINLEKLKKYLLFS